MEISIKSIVLLSSILLTGLTAGLCFTWSNAITPGIGKLTDLMFLQSFQSMNRVIVNPSFLIVFFGPIILFFANTYYFRNTNPDFFWTLLVAALLFFVGVGMITIFKNIPLNELLDKTQLEVLNASELKDLRQTFEKPWNRWHMVRTISSFTSFALLLSAIIFNK
ncbi:anthrone oxygenase family protein [Aureisphaera sp.]